MREEDCIDVLGPEPTQIGKLLTTPLIEPTIDEIGCVRSIDSVAASSDLSCTTTRSHDEWSVGVGHDIGMLKRI
jgi:hypothetical protein